MNNIIFYKSEVCNKEKCNNTCTISTYGDYCIEFSKTEKTISRDFFDKKEGLLNYYEQTGTLDVNNWTDLFEKLNLFLYDCSNQVEIYRDIEEYMNSLVFPFKNFINIYQTCFDPNTLIITAETEEYYYCFYSAFS